MEGGRQELIKRILLPIVAVVDGKDDRIGICKFADALSATSAGRAWTDISRPADDGDLDDTFTALLHHRGNGGGFGGQGIAMLVPTLLELGTEEQKRDVMEILASL